MMATKNHLILDGSAKTDNTWFSKRGFSISNFNTEYRKYIANDINTRVSSLG